MRVDDRARVTYAAATPVVLKVFGERQQAATITRIVKALSFCKLPAIIAENVKALGFCGSRAHVMRTRRLHARMRVFVSTYQWHGYSDINMFVDDAPLKHARASFSFRKSCRESSVASHQNGGFATILRA
jgi:hypothetical protein